jgi:low temperature requirement protein LtrA
LLHLSPFLRVDRLSADERRSTWLELFYDLVFVAAVAQLGTLLSKHLTVDGFWLFTAMFILIWWCWSGATNFASRYQLPEVTTRLLTGLELMSVCLMAGAIGATHQLLPAVNGTSSLVLLSVPNSFIGGYALVRGLLIVRYLMAASQHPNVRPPTLLLCLGFAVGVGICLLSLLWPHWQIPLWMTGFVVDYVVIIGVTTRLTHVLPNAGHLPERFGLFTIIVLGECVLAVVTSLGHGAFTGGGWWRAGVSFIIAFAIWWRYFDGLSNTVVIQVAQVTHHVGRLNGWLFSHVFLHAGLVLMSVGLRLFIPTPSALTLKVTLVGACLAALALQAIYTFNQCLQCAVTPGLILRHLAWPLALAGLTVWVFVAV